jgi:hypothetical protein
MPTTDPNDPVIVALKAHGRGCFICSRAINRADRPGDIRVFELCGEGQRVIRDTKFAVEGAPPTPAADPDAPPVGGGL